MKHIKRIASSFLFTLLCLTSFAQTVVWQMKPADYNEISRINSNLYKVSRNGKIGLITSDGGIVAPVENDNLSLFYDNVAIMTMTDEMGERVTGTLTADGKYTSFLKKYYIIPKQNFFSEGLLTVKDENGKSGYIDRNGNQVLGFNGEYDKIKPFTEGYAVTIKKDKQDLIDKEGNRVKFRFKGVGEVREITNPYKGKVYLIGKAGKFYSFWIGGDGYCETAVKPKNLTTDFLYRLSAYSGEGKSPNFTDILNNGSLGPSPVISDSKYGFTKDDVSILAPQLALATQFEDGLSVAGINGQLGILRYVDNEYFNVNIPTSKYNFYSGDKVDCKFILSVPPSWRGGNLNVLLKDENGIVIPVERDVDNFTFSVSPAKSGELNYSVKVFGDNLMLYQSDLSFSFNMKKRCAVCGKDLDKCSGHQKTEKETQQNKNDNERCTYPGCGKLIKDCKYRGIH